jgi:hypothetical protein
LRAIPHYSKGAKLEDGSKGADTMTGLYINAYDERGNRISRNEVTRIEALKIPQFRTGSYRLWLDDRTKVDLGSDYLDKYLVGWREYVHTNSEEDDFQLACDLHEQTDAKK